MRDDDDDTIKEFENSLDKGSLTDSSREMLARLTVHQAKILRDKYGISFKTDHTLREIGKQFEVTKERIQKIERKALKKIKTGISEVAPKCSFCDKSTKEAKKMIASESNNTYICDECIKNCMELIDE
ncbi:ClpX C4-type zinc finger protein [Aurantivibrio infirmus]